MDISGNKADTNTDKECVLGDLYLGVAVLYKKLNLNEKSNVSRPKRLIREYWKKKIKELKIPEANKLCKPIYYFFKSQS